jgi:hypothetical protein
MLASQRALIKAMYKRENLEPRGLPTLRTKLDLTYTRYNHTYNLNEILHAVTSFNYQVSFHQKWIRAHKIPRCHFHRRIPCSPRVHDETQGDVNLKYKFKASYLLNCNAVYTIHMRINNTNFAALSVRTVRYSLTLLYFSFGCVLSRSLLLYSRYFDI